MKKILMLCDSYLPDLSYQESLLAKYYKKLGLEVVVIASGETNIFNFYQGKKSKYSKTIQSIDGIKVYRLPYVFDLFGRIRVFGGVSSILASEKPDYIFVHDIHFNLHHVVKYKKNKDGCKIILDFHSDFVNSGRNMASLFILHYLLRGIYLRLHLKNIDKIYSVVPGGIDFMERIYLVERDRINLFPLGVDLDAIIQLRNIHSRVEMRKFYNIPKDAKCIFSGGRFTKNKKIQYLIEVMKDFPNSYLILVGDFDDEDPLYKKKMISLIETNPNIILCGWKTPLEMYMIMSGCDFAVFPGSQTVLWQQSMGMGLPIIISKYFERSGNFVDQMCEYLLQGNNLQIIDGRFDLISDLKNSIFKFSDEDFLTVAKNDAKTFAEKELSYEHLAISSLKF